jgi:transcription elongation factor Elf1
LFLKKKQATQMAKRKSTRKPAPKQSRQILDKTFSCLFCNHERAIEIKLLRDQSLGKLVCRVCGVTWETDIMSLSEPIDVYSEWIDACEEAQQTQKKQPVKVEKEKEEEDSDEDFEGSDDELPAGPLLKKRKEPTVKSDLSDEDED